MGISKQIQKFEFSVDSFDVFNHTATNKDMKYMIESHTVNNLMKKNCFQLYLTCDSEDKNSDITLVLTSNCQLRFYVNLNTISTLVSKISDVILKERIEADYYKELSTAALNKINQYSQIGVSYAVIFFLSL